MNKDFLKNLLEVPSPSGCEIKGIEVWKNEMKDFECYYEDKSGNTAYSIGSGPVKVLLSGHIDEICMAIRMITDNGYLIPKNMGGVDKKVLPGSEVLLLSDLYLDNHGNLIKGVVQKNPIHIEHSEEKSKDKVLDFSDLRIDIGAESKEEVIRLGLHVGSLIVNGRLIDLDFGTHRLHGNSLDDKVGVFVVSNILKKLKEDSGKWKETYTIIGLACIGEESGLLGAHRAAREINPDISIDFDVTHACDTDQFDKKKYGDILLGKGPVVEWGQDKSRRINNLIKSIGLDYQESVSRIGGTNTKEFFLESVNAETTLISLPLTSMHTAIETMDWRDIESTIEIMLNLIVKCML